MTEIGSGDDDGSRGDRIVWIDGFGDDKIIRDDSDDISAGKLPA
ncbi:hypothetical protein PENSOL_c120G00908 [Penicillium solitum]|uniref:Uncharacterized protein n=1 Tax=Penicillium solitum TaxID=60172 RepID=A0A1V6Q5E5_9EURO|nr:uncharacterized protein PENSOL_c120G00908 [Penicillium solitum]OQD84483.1 hypothetical protein PENSOL_c120G00908 [Penicillium solitum]